jgi:GT2 family glycosyltransferase
VSALRDLGGCDARFRFRHDYHLRLRLSIDQPLCRIPEILCTAPSTRPDKDPGAEALFFPGRGKLGGFSYLFMNPDEEKEIEEIFYRFLKLSGAYLDRSPGGTFVRSKGISPRVSVVIPVHNRAGFLPLAIASVQSGTFEDFEIIIVDNASEDDTLEVARNLANEDKRIHVISLPDNIIAKALNTGVACARGEYIAQLDSDDEYTPQTLEVMVRALDDNVDWALAISYYDLMDESGNILEDFGIIKHLEYNRNNILRVDGAGALRCWRKAAIDELGGFNEKDFGHYGEDYDLVLRAGEKWEVGRVHQVLYHYRRHPDNSDVLRPHAMKIKNKTLARRRALERRKLLNQNRT